MTAAVTDTPTMTPRTREVLKRAGNPFRNYFARNPDDEVCARYHVPELFAAERDLLHAIIDLYRYDPLTHSEVVPVLGNKGAGKTHLLHSIKHGLGGQWQLLVTPGVYQKDTEFLEYLLFQIIDTLLGGGKQKGVRPLEYVGDQLVRRGLGVALRDLPAEQKVELFPPPGLGRVGRYLGLGLTQAQERAEWLAENLSGYANFGRTPTPLGRALEDAGLTPQKAFDLFAAHVQRTEARNTAGLMRRHIYQGFARAALLNDESDLAEFLTYGFAELEFHVRPTRQDLVLALFKVLMEVFRSLKTPVVVAFDQLEDLLLARRSDDAHRTAEAFFAGIVQVMHQIDGLCFLIFAERGLWNRFVPSLDGYIQDRLNNPVHVPKLGTVKAIRLEAPPVELFRRVVEARLRPCLDELPDGESVPDIFPFTDEQIARIARTEPTLRDMLQQCRHLFDHLVYGPDDAAPGEPRGVGLPLTAAPVVAPASVSTAPASALPVPVTTAPPPASAATTSPPASVPQANPTTVAPPVPGPVTGPVVGDAQEAPWAEVADDQDPRPEASHAPSFNPSDLPPDRPDGLPRSIPEPLRRVAALLANDIPDGGADTTPSTVSFKSVEIIQSPTPSGEALPFATPIDGPDGGPETSAGPAPGSSAVPPVPTTPLPTPAGSPTGPAVTPTAPPAEPVGEVSPRLPFPALPVPMQPSTDRVAVAARGTASEVPAGQAAPPESSPARAGLPSFAELWDQEQRAARRKLEPEGALTGATRELQAGLGAFLSLCHEHGVKVGPWRLQHVVPEWTFGDHPTYGAVTIAHWACKDGQPWKVGIGLFLARGAGKPKDLEVKLSVMDTEPAVVDYLVLLRPEDDLTLSGKSKTCWQDAERRGKHARLEAVSLDGFAQLYSFPRWLATVRESLPEGMPLPNLADIIQEKCEKLLEQVCMPVQG